MALVLENKRDRVPYLGEPPSLFSNANQFVEKKKIKEDASFEVFVLSNSIHQTLSQAISSYSALFV